MPQLIESTVKIFTTEDNFEEAKSLLNKKNTIHCIADGSTVYAYFGWIFMCCVIYLVLKVKTELLF